MAVKQVRECDVFGTTKNVTGMRVLVMVGEHVGNLTPADIELALGGEVRCFDPVDMSPRASERLGTFIARGMTPTAKTKKAILTAEAAKAAAPTTTNTGT